VLTWLLALLAMIGVDLLLHAGLLAPLYDWGKPFLLTPQQAIVRIPAGYLAFGVLAGSIVWLFPRLRVVTAYQGALTGGAAGAVLWAALLLGIWSISTAEPQLLGAWWLGGTIQLAVGGSIVGAALGGHSLRSLARWSVAAMIVGLVAAIVLQSIGYALAPVIVTG
jgi:hypothetical protein